MTKRNQKVLGICGASIALLVCFTRPAFALIPVLPVFDGANYLAIGHIWSQDISNYAKLAQTVLQLQKIYTSGLQLYQLEQAMSHNITHKQAWMAAGFSVADQQTMQRYGQQVSWESVMNGNINNFGRAYTQSTYSGGMVSFGSGGASPFNLLLPNANAQNSRYGSNAASMGMIDSANAQCAQVLAANHSNQNVNSAAFNTWLQDAIANDSARNSTVAVLNVMTGGMIHGVTENKTRNAIANCEAQMAMQQIIIERNRMAQENQFFAIYAHAKAVNPTTVDPNSTYADFRNGYIPQ